MSWEKGEEQEGVFFVLFILTRKLEDTTINISGYEDGINISDYSETNPYTLPKGGIVKITSNTSNTSVKAAFGVDGIGTVAITTYPFPSSLYLPKGTKVFNRAYEGSIVNGTPKAYSTMLFYAEK